MLGLSNGDSGQSYTDIDFALYAYSDSTLHAYEGGVYAGHFGTYAAGDRLRVAVEGGQVRYLRNGVAVGVSSRAVTYPLVADAALYDTGATLTNVVLSGVGQSAGGAVQWLVTDHLGTPRMVIDQTGNLAGIKRHDYLPFGEEVGAGVGGRMTQQGYVAGNVRQKFTTKERDGETNLDYFVARYYSATMGRFISPDEFAGGPDKLFDFVDEASENPTFYADLDDPQTLNKYQYCYNNPLAYVDPDGHLAHIPSFDGEKGRKDPEGTGWYSENSDWDYNSAHRIGHKTPPRRPNPSRRRDSRDRPGRSPRKTGGPVPARQLPVYYPPGTPPPMGDPGSSGPWGSHLNPVYDPLTAATSFGQFKRMVGTTSNFEWHHVVEQHNYYQARFGRPRLNYTGNLIPLERSMHQRISGYYSSKQEFTGGRTVREWVREQSFEQQHAFGIKVLRDFGAIP